MTIRIFLLALLFAPFLGAEEPVPTPLMCRSLCFQRVNEVKELLVGGKAAEDLETCPLPLQVPSKPFLAGALNGKLSFRAEREGPVLAVGSVPSGLKKALLFFVPLPKPTADGRIYKVLVINDDGKGLPDGGAFVCNLYGGDVRFIIGEHKKQLQGGKSTSVTQPKQRDDFNMATVAFQFKQGERWRMASETRLRFTSGLRHLIFTYVDPKTKRPKLKTYRDIQRTP